MIPGVLKTHYTCAVGRPPYQDRFPLASLQSCPELPPQTRLRSRRSFAPRFCRQPCYLLCRRLSKNAQTSQPLSLADVARRKLQSQSCRLSELRTSLSPPSNKFTDTCDIPPASLLDPIHIRVPRLRSPASVIRAGASAHGFPQSNLNSAILHHLLHKHAHPS